jgi:hypothetical protein
MGQVGVDPGRIAQAATALEGLRDALAANVPVIVNTLNSYWSGGTGSPVSLGVLQQALGRAPGDAADMRSRARLAALLAEGQAVSLPGHGMVDIPFGGQELENADAEAEAWALAHAEASSSPQAARAAIQAIQQDLQDQLDVLDHGDACSQATAKAFLAAFYNQAAPQVASLALTLHGEDGQGMTVLTRQDGQILNTYAQGLAAVDKAGRLSSASASAFSAKAGSLWSVGMLFKFGPSGSAYGTQEAIGQENLVAQVTQAIELARMRGGYTIPLAGKDVSVGAWGADEVTQVIQQFDPAQAMLTLAAQNGAAAREVLAGPDGQQIASDLMTRPVTQFEPVFTGNGTLQGFMPLAAPTAYSDGKPIDFSEPLYATSHPLTIPPQVIGQFFSTATAAPRGASTVAYDSALAAIHLVGATPPPIGTNGIVLPEQVRSALMTTFASYMPDLAKSLADPGTSPVEKADGVYVISVGTSQLDTYLQQLGASKDDYIKIQGMAGSAIGTSTALKIQHMYPPGLSNPTAAFSQLYGDISIQAAQAGISQAEQEDLHHQVLNVIIQMAELGFNVLPLGNAAYQAAKPLVYVIRPLTPQFSTGNAAKAEAAAQGQLRTEEIMAMVPFVRGLEQAGVQLPDPPPPGSFDASGAPTQEFFDWWANIGAGETLNGETLGDVPGGWVPGIQQEMGFGAGN